CASRPGTATRSRKLNLQDFLELGQVPRPVGADGDYVFQADAAHGWIVKPGFHRHNVAGLEDIVGSEADAGGFMEFHAQAVPGAVKEALHAAIFLAGLVALALK